MKYKAQNNREKIYWRCDSNSKISWGRKEGLKDLKERKGDDQRGKRGIKRAQNQPPLT